MPFPYEFPLDFDAVVMGMLKATLVRTGPVGIMTSRLFPTAIMAKVTMTGMVSQEEAMAGIVMKRHDLSGEIE